MLSTDAYSHTRTYVLVTVEKQEEDFWEYPLIGILKNSQKAPWLLVMIRRCTELVMDIHISLHILKGSVAVGNEKTFYKEDLHD